MGLLWFIGLNGLLVAVLIGFVRRPGSLAKAVREWLANPVATVFLFMWGTSIFVAGWGVLSGGRLSWLVPTPWGAFQSWKIAGILVFVCLAVFFVCSAYEGHVYRKRMESDRRNDS